MGRLKVSRGPSGSAWAPGDFGGAGCTRVKDETVRRRRIGVQRRLERAAAFKPSEIPLNNMMLIFSGEVPGSYCCFAVCTGLARRL